MAAFGFSNICWKPIIHTTITARALFLRSLLSVAILLVVTAATALLPVHWQLHSLLHGQAESAPAFLKSAGAILLSLTGLWLFIESMRHSNAGISGVVVCCSSILSAITGWWWGNEAFPIAVGVAFLLAFLGVLFLDDWRSWKKPSARGILLSLGGAFFWAISNLGFKQGNENLGVLPFSLLQESIVLLVSGSGFLAARIRPSRKNEAQNAITNIPLLATISACTVAGVLCCNIGLNQLPLVLFSLLVMVQPVTTLISARLFLMERLNGRQWVGISLILCGIFIGLTLR